MPRELRERFLDGSRPLMKYTNLLSFNLRAICLYAACLLDQPWAYFLIEIVVLGVLYLYMHRKHETLCARMMEEMK